MSAPTSESEVSFNIAVSDEQLSVLQQKLALTTFPDELEGAGRDYGAPLADIRRLVSRWKEGYDWRKHEAQLNAELPQFTRDIEVEGHGTLNIHYVHKKSEVVDAIPLLFVHGCESNILGMYKSAADAIISSRAWKFHGSSKNPTFACTSRCRTSKLSCRCVGFAWIWVFRSTQETRLRIDPVCRGVYSLSTVVGFAVALISTVQVGNKLMLALGYNEYGKEMHFF